MDVHARPVAERDRQGGERAGVAGESDRERRQLVPRLVVPQVGCHGLGRHGARCPQPANDAVLAASGLFAERAQGPPERLDSGPIPVGEARRQPVEEEVRRAWRLRPRRRGAGALCDPYSVAGAEAADEDLRAQRLDVGLACEPGVKRFQPFGRIEQQRRRVASATLGEHDVGAHAGQSRALERIQRSDLRGREELVRRLGGSGLELRLRRSQRSGAAPGGIGREVGRPLEEGGRRRYATAALCPIGRAFQLAGHRLVGAERRLGAMPRPAVGVGVRIGHLGQRAMYLLPLLPRGRAVGRGARQRMTEPHPGAELDQPVRLGRRGGVGADPEHLGRTPQQGHVPDRLRRRCQEEPLRVDRERPDTPKEALLDEVRDRPGVGTAEPARQLRRGQPSGQLQQRERISIRLGDDPIADPFVQSPGDHRAQQRTGLRVAQAPDHHHRETAQCLVLTRVTHGEDHGHRFRQKSSRDEPEDLRRRPIEPLCVVDQAYERLLLGHLGQQTEDCQPDQEAVRSGSTPQAERGAERIALRTRQTLEPIQKRRAELLQPGERELHLGLDARRSRDATLRRPLHQVVQQGGLADPRLAAHDQHLAPPRPHALQQPLDRLALVTPTAQSEPRTRLGRIHSDCGRHRHVDLSSTSRPSKTPADQTHDRRAAPARSSAVPRSFVAL